MSASISLHRTDSKSANVRNFSADNKAPAFTSVSVWDDEKNSEVTLFFANPSEAYEFALSIEKQIERLGSFYRPENFEN